MTVEDTIKDMLTCYDKLFITRADCLNHLFITVGNGYDWINGQLVINGLLSHEPIEDYNDSEHLSDDPYNLDDETIKVRMKERADLYRLVQDKDCVKRDLERYEKTGVINNWSLTWSRDRSKIVNFPDNIKNDWKNAIKECVLLMVNDEVPYAREIESVLKNRGFCI